MAQKKYKKILTIGLAVLILSVSALIVNKTSAVFTGPTPITNGRIVYATKLGTTSSVADSIVSSNPDGSDKVTLFQDTDTIIVGDPVWSQDQQKIAFVITKGSTGGIYTINGTDANQTPTQLTDDPVADGVAVDPSWSPDDSKILFARAVNGVSNIFIMDADGTNQTQLTSGYTTSGHQAFDPQWNPVSGSKQIVFTVADTITTPSINSNIHTATLNSGDTAFVSASDQELPGASWNASDTNSQGQTGNDVIRGEYDAQFSPDGTNVIFVRRTPGGSYSIGTVPATGGTDSSYKTVISYAKIGSSPAYDPAYSPDGNFVLFEPKSGLLSVGALKIANITTYNDTGDPNDVTVSTFVAKGAEGDWTYASTPQPTTLEDVSVTCTTEVGKACTISIPAYCTNQLSTPPAHGTSVVTQNDDATQAGSLTYTPTKDSNGNYSSTEENYVHVRDNNVDTAKCNVKIIFTSSPINIPKTGVVGGLAGLGLAAAIAGTAIYVKEYKTNKAKKLNSDK